MRKIFLGTIAIFAFLGIFALAKDTYALEGITELRSTTGESYRCYATSILMQDQNFTILVSCRDLIYPAGKTVFSYVLWAQPVEGGNPRKLGELGFGRLSAKMNEPFSSLFVTTEQNPGGKPTGPTVMRGNVSPIGFLDRPTTPTPTSISSTTGSPQITGEITPTPQALSTSQKLSTALRRAGLAAFIALLALIGLVFAITRARG